MYISISDRYATAYKAWMENKHRFNGLKCGLARLFSLSLGISQCFQASALVRQFFSFKICITTSFRGIKNQEEKKQNWNRSWCRTEY